MFIDWLTAHQDFAERLPFVGPHEILVRCTDTGEVIHCKQPTFQHAGSYSTTIQIRIAGNRITVSGNPSRFNRMENLFGLTSFDDAIAVYNRILSSLGLPEFTKCTRVFYSQQPTGRAVRLSDGAVFTEVHITSNRSVGLDCKDEYLRALSSLPYRNSVPRLHINGKTVDWLTKSGTGGRLIYPSVYDKANELSKHALPKIKKQFGENSAEFKYLKLIIDYCESYGVVRFEQKMKSEFLRRENLNFYGLCSLNDFRKFHEEFLNIDEKLSVESMNLETITQRLMREHICETVKSANTTALYAVNWMHGTKFDLSKRQVKEHRSRLRKIGIDIALTCDLTKFSLVTVRHHHTINVRSLPIPDFYQRPQSSHLRLVA